MLHNITSTIWKNRKTIIITNLGIIILGLILCFVLPPVYTARSTFVRVGTTPFEAGAMLGALAKLPFIFKEQNLLDPYNIATTRWVMNKVIEKESLMTYYNAEDIEAVYGIYLNRITVETKMDGMVVISYKDRDPKKAASICNTIVDVIDRFQKQSKLYTTSDYLDFLTTAKIQLEGEITSIRDSLATLMEQYGVWLDYEHIGDILNTMPKSLREEIIKKEMEYHYYLSQQGENNPITQRVKKELSFLYQRWEELYQKGIQTYKKHTVFPALEDVPSVFLSFLAFRAELSIKEDLYKMIMTEYYRSLFQKKKEVKSIQVIDYAVPPIHRSFPKRKLMMMGFLILALLFDFLLVQYKLSKK